jgi:hydrocephalus-inducing protein
MPLFDREQVIPFTLHTAELGDFAYELKIKPLRAPEDPPIQFSAAIGQSQSHTLKFVHFAKSKLEFQCKIDSPDFLVDKVVAVTPASQPNGSEAAVEVTFEPSRAGQSNAVLTLSSPVAGEYSWSLVGMGTMPKPQGPIVLKTGTNSGVISFKNVFSTQMVFNLAIDHSPIFSVKACETIGPKKSATISVTYKPQGPTSPRTSKLTIANASTGMKWVYYLKIQEK